VTLRIERVGPDEIHWTIIGLPELIRGNKKKRKEHVPLNAERHVA
jgi:hypothetical protein